MAQNTAADQGSGGETVGFPVPSEGTLMRIALYFDMKMQKRVDRAAEESFLDHPGLNDWLDKVRNRHGIANTCYTHRR